MRARCFISYCRPDRDFAWFLRTLLSAYPDQLEVWMDTSLEGGVRFEQEIFRELDHATVFLPVATRAFLESDFCRRETARFIARMEQAATLRMIPLRIDASPLQDAPFADRQWIDFSQWLIRGDHIFRQALLPRILGQPGSRTVPSDVSSRGQHSDNGEPDPSEAAAERPELEPSPDSASPWRPQEQGHGEPFSEQAAAALRSVLSDYRAKIDTDIQRLNLCQLVVSFTQTPALNPLTRADLVTELSDLYIREGRWPQVARYNLEALDLLRTAGVTPDNLAGQPDEAKRLLGNVLSRIALARRKLREGGTEAHLKDALAAFEQISDILARHDHCAQVHRELGTFLLIRGEFEKAREHFNESLRLLEPLPSQRLHVVQAHIKLAQTDLLEGRIDEARERLVPLLAQFPEADPRSEFLEVIHCHFLITLALLYAASKSPRRALEVLSRHRAIARRQGFRNELIKNRLLTTGVPVLTLTPRTLLSRVVRRYFRGG